MDLIKFTFKFMLFRESEQLKFFVLILIRQIFAQVHFSNAYFFQVDRLQK